MTPPHNRDTPLAPAAPALPRGRGHVVWWRVLGCAAVVLAAVLLGAWVRLVRLDNRPMHCDEANQAIKFGRLLEDQTYVYDPRDHHGPSLNYLTLPVVRAAGYKRLVDLSEAHLRLPPALFGIVLIALVCLLGRQLGSGGVAVAAVLCALSPAFVFYSRYYIHETLLVVFTFGALVCLCRFARAAGTCSAGQFAEQRRNWWLCCAPWAVGFGLCVAMMHASKETCVIALAAMAVAAVCLFRRDRCERVKAAHPDEPQDGVASGAGEKPSVGAPDKPSRWIVGRADWRRIALAGGLAVVVAVLLSAVLFSSFVRNPRGVLDSYTTYFYYLGRASGEGSTGRHVQPWHYYFRILFGPQQGDTAWWPDGAEPPAGLAKWPRLARLATRPLYWPELPVAGLALLGLVAAVWGRGMPAGRRPAARFLAVYTLLMIGVYSAVPYKTPWCALSLLHGMILLAGIGTCALWAGFARPAAGSSASAAWISPAGAWWVHLWRWTCRLAAVLLLVGSVGWLGWQTWITSFRAYEDPASPFVYSHTTSEVLDLVEQVEQITAAQPEGRGTYIQVVCPDHDHWPLPWYLRRFERVAWSDRPPEGPPAPLIITQPDLRGELIEYLYVKQPPGRRRLYVPMVRDDGRGWQLRPYVRLEILLRLDARDRYLRSLEDQPAHAPR